MTRIRPKLSADGREIILAVHHFNPDEARGLAHDLVRLADIAAQAPTEAEHEEIIREAGKRLGLPVFVPVEKSK